jgi:hypothetical protein
MTTKNALPTKRIRELYGMAVHWDAYGPAHILKGNYAEFDAWLEEHDRELSEKVWDETYEDLTSVARPLAGNPYSKES